MVTQIFESQVGGFPGVIKPSLFIVFQLFRKSQFVFGGSILLTVPDRGLAWVPSLFWLSPDVPMVSLLPGVSVEDCPVASELSPIPSLPC